MEQTIQTRMCPPLPTHTHTQREREGELKLHVEAGIMVCGEIISHFNLQSLFQVLLPPSPTPPGPHTHTLKQACTRLPAKDCRTGPAVTVTLTTDCAPSWRTYQTTSKRNSAVFGCKRNNARSTNTAHIHSVLTQIANRRGSAVFGRRRTMRNP